MAVLIEEITGCISLLVILWVYYSFVVRPAEKVSSLLQEDSVMDEDILSDHSTKRETTETFSFIDGDIDLTDEEKCLQKTILMTLMQADGKLRKPV